MLRYYKDVYTHMVILRTLVYANKYIMYEKYVYCLFHGIASVFIIIVVFYRIISIWHSSGLDTEKFIGKTI